MTLTELLNSGPSAKFTIAVTRDGEYWSDMGWYNSPKLCIAAAKKRPYPPRWSEFKEIRVLRRDFIENTSDITPTDLSIYGIKFE